jgi:hypothetical protein
MFGGGTRRGIVGDYRGPEATHLSVSVSVSVSVYFSVSVSVFVCVAMFACMNDYTAKGDLTGAIQLRRDEPALPKVFKILLYQAKYTPWRVALVKAYKE